MIKRLLGEPLVHFFGLGALVFAYFAATADPEPAFDANVITIPSADLERSALAWTQRWKRPPTPEELQGLIGELVREEVLYREALALGLDRDDVVIRRLLRQKFEFVTQDLAVDPEPDEATLRAFHKANADRYSRDAVLTFSQILFSPDRRGASAEADALQTLSDLSSASGPEAAASLGDGGALAPDYGNLAEFEAKALFGPEFADALSRLEPGRWSGPIQSGYGLHLVWLESRVPGASLPFEEVEERVHDDWRYEQRRAANEAIYQKLLERYEVVVEPLPEAPGSEASGS